MHTPYLALALLLAAGQGVDERVPLYDGLGNHHHPITTAVPRAQDYFDQGLRLTYAFNHAEAIRSFQEAQRLDPSCAMCFWGEAYARGPNINAPMAPSEVEPAWAALEKARSLLDNTTPRERSYIEALTRRYAPGDGGDRAALDRAWAEAITQVATRYPDDDDALTLMAEAVMDLTPWDYWADARTPRPAMAGAIEALEKVLARNPDHAGACHFYIHAVEATQPHRAEACADRLASLMPAAGHIVHMPAHIFVRVGRYADAIERNVHAMHADHAIIGDMAPDGIYRLGYVPHNPDFLRFAASMAGSRSRSLEGARDARGSIAEELLVIPEMAFAQHFHATPFYVMIRFGMWDEILQQPAPGMDLAYGRGVRHYARGLALAARGEVAAARQELEALKSTLSAPELATSFITAENSLLRVLTIAEAELAGEIAVRSGDMQGGLVLLRKAAALEDAMTYDEPPSWHMPIRHRLGAVLLASGDTRGAEAVYREDLAKYPGNVWSLAGLIQALQDRGSDRGELGMLTEEFREASRLADVRIEGSVFR
jgi:tetratricopeptide (TPR) repeat protein